jgi:hypothetical protein
MGRFGRVLACLAAVLIPGRHAAAQTLALPPRLPSALPGSVIAGEVRDLPLEAREERLYDEIAGGNVPAWLRRLQPVEVQATLGGQTHRVVFRVAPDYLAVGSDDDYLLVPLSPQTAQRLADLVNASLPTPLMADAIWRAAGIRLEPAPIPPSPEMTTVAVFETHARMVRKQRSAAGQPPGVLVAGHKKDVVITARLAASPGKVAIYGWHRPDGTPIQPLYTGHTDRWVDYSHGIRLVSREVMVDGVPRDLPDILGDERLAGLLSDEGTVPMARYPTVRSDTTATVPPTRAGGGTMGAGPQAADAGKPPYDPVRR